jgi:hypothetical protein
LTRRANQGHDSIIALLVNAYGPADNGRFGAIADKKFFRQYFMTR